MYSTDAHIPGSQPLQLIEKAQSYSEDDDLLSPYDDGEVERQMKRAWWKTCSLFTFLLATLGIVMFIIIRDNNGEASSNSGKNEIDIRQQIKQFFQSDRSETGSIATFSSTKDDNDDNNINNNKNDMINNDNNNNNDNDELLKQRLSHEGPLPKSAATDMVGSRVTLRKLYDESSKHCVTSIVDRFVDSGELADDNELLTLSSIETGFFSILDEFGSVSMKQASSIKEYLTKSSELGYYSAKLNKDFDIQSLTINAKSDALVFVITIDWESMFGNKLPYSTSKVVTSLYDPQTCEIGDLTPVSFTQCFNGKCEKIQEHDSNVVSYLNTLVDNKSGK